MRRGAGLLEGRKSLMPPNPGAAGSLAGTHHGASMRSGLGLACGFPSCGRNVVARASRPATFGEAAPRYAALFSTAAAFPIRLPDPCLCAPAAGVA